ncbi:shieldin complex subunit 1 isoform X4 [Equus przewalskii]|uniref:Shieldin complex subunit 1 isoform X4 n=1 Tax=Equus przewalskii TaxID=9798 RepID=A0ABM4LU79_EQUPR|nr:uncharacterized protein C20orf196 homolog isoform X3 [Equus caballus]
MAAGEATPGSLSEESSALDLPSACDLRDYVLQRPGQEPNSEAFSSVEALSTPCSSDVDPVSWRKKPGMTKAAATILMYRPRSGAF